MAITVSSTATTPTHHLKLSDGSNEVGLILRANGRPDPRAIERRPRANGQYSPFTQSDWSSGRGIKDAQADRSRYADGKRAITRHGGTVMLGGQETFTTGYRQQEQYMPGKLAWTSLLTTNRYIAYKFTASATGNREKIYLWIRRRGTPTSTLTVELCSNNAGDPGTVLKTVTKTTSDIRDTVSELVEFIFSSVQAVTSTTVYWIKVYTSSADSSTNYWQVGTETAGTNNLTEVSSDGSTWADASYDLYFRIVDDTDQLGGLFFNYKNSLYFVTRPSGAAAPKLYINGDRGVATGTHSTVTLQDTTKSWTANEWAESILLIIDGTNSEWQTPYRTIISNTSDTLTFSDGSSTYRRIGFPKAPVSGDTVYVIIGSNKWTEIAGHGLTVLPTSVVSAGDTVYFAQGDAVLMRRMREYLSNAAWTRQFAAEDNYAKFLLDYRNPSKGLMVCKTNDSGTLGQPVFAQAKAEEWGRRLNYPRLLNDAEATTGWTAGANCAIALVNTDYVIGKNSLKFTLSGAPGSPSWYYALPAAIVANTCNAVRFWVKSLSGVAAGVLKVFLSTSATAASQIELLTVPELAGAEWTQVTLPYNNKTAGTGFVASVGFLTTSTSNYYLIDGLELFVIGSEVPLGNEGEKINGMERYGDPEVPWVFRSQSAGSIEGGVFNPVPLREMSQAENVHNGMGHVVSNVYLYFSFLHGLERFYRNNLDDVGPNRDEGLPDERRGFITSMQAYPGRFFYNYDVTEGYSAIFESASGTDHHEIYRCDTPGKRIRNLCIQVIPGDAADRLWFTEGDDIAWLPLPGNTLKEDTDDTFLHTHEAVLETGWIYGAESDAVKLFSSVKLFLENVSANRPVEWDYKKDEETSWTAVSTSFTSPPVQEVSLNVSCKRLKLRFRLLTNDNTETPMIRSMVINAVTRPEIRYTFTLNTQADDAGINLEGEEDTSQRAATIISRLDAWCAANTILTMSAVFSPFDGKTVYLEPPVIRPLSIVFDESAEKLSMSLTLVEP
jgi:hypothetical protein